MNTKCDKVRAIIRHVKLSAARAARLSFDYDFRAVVST